jgi:hypothetical protein
MAGAADHPPGFRRRYPDMRRTGGARRARAGPGRPLYRRAHGDEHQCRHPRPRSTPVPGGRHRRGVLHHRRSRRGTPRRSADAYGRCSCEDSRANCGFQWARACPTALSVHLLIQHELKNGGDGRFAVANPLEVCVTVEWKESRARARPSGLFPQRPQLGALGCGSSDDPARFAWRHPPVKPIDGSWRW